MSTVFLSMDQAIECRICRGNDPPLITPCDCTQGHVHLECLARWANASNRTCEICQVPYRVELPRFSNRDATKIYLLALIVVFYTAGLACFDVFVTDLSISVRAILAGCQIGLCATAAFVGATMLCRIVQARYPTRVCVPTARRKCHLHDFSVSNGLEMVRYFTAVVIHGCRAPEIGRCRYHRRVRNRI